MRANDGVLARNLAAWRALVDAAWPNLRIKSVSNNLGESTIGEEILVSVTAFLDSLTPEDLSVQFLSGRVDAHGEIKSPNITPMTAAANEGNGCYRFQAYLRTTKSGFFG